MATRLSTKDKIIELLRKKSNLTVQQLSKLLGITEMAVRKHLNSLDRDSLLLIKEVKQSIGRPIQVYSLSENANRFFPNHYEDLTLEFLHDLEELHGVEMIEYLLEKRSARQIKNYLPQMKNKNFDEKIKELIHIQNNKGYMTELNHSGNGTYEFTEHNCPIMAVAKEYTMACSCETQMFKKVLGTENVKRVSCKTDNGDHCRFVIHEEK